MPQLDLRLLGGFSLSLDGAPLEGLAQPRLQALIAYLALHRSAPIPRAHLAAALWPETSDEQALKNLRTLLARLRMALPAAGALIAAAAHTVEWQPGAPVALDVAAVEEALARAADARDLHAASAALAAATALYAGDLLPGCHDEWLLPERERLRAAWLAALEELTACHETARDVRAALAAAQRLMRADPLHEGAYAAAMRAQLALGDRAGALRTYHACAALLRDELGVDPGPATQAVYEHVLMADAEPVAGEQSTVTSEEPRPRRAQSPSSTLQSPPLIGRAAELAWLQARWREAASGAAQVALEAGEAGIGKTRLAEELLAWVERQEGGADIAVAHCYAGVQVAYAPVAEWLRSPAVQPRLRRADPARRSEAARLLPELLADDPALERPGPIGEAWQRHRFYQGIAAALLGGGQDAPLLLLLEDVQWADAETLEWLAFFANRAADDGAPLLLLLTLRAEEAGEDGALTTLRRSLQRAGRLHEITLHPLDEEQTAALAAALGAADTETTALSTALHAGDGAAADAAARLFRDTEGNPLFIVETVRAGIEPYALEPGAEDAVPGLPPTLLAVLRHRLGLLSPGAHELAEHAAVLGRAFRYDALAAMLGGEQGDGRADEEELVRRLDELWRTRIVREQGADAYDFSHDKLRAVAYAGLSSARRRLLHRRAAAALEHLHAANLTPVSAAIAAHFEAAGDLAAALPHYRRAAAAAQAVYALPAAVGLYRHLLDNDFAPLLSPAEKCDLLLELGDVLEWSGNGIEAEKAARAAIAEAAALGDGLRLAWAHFHLGAALCCQSAFEEVLPALALARAGFEAAGDRHGLLQVLWVASAAYQELGDRVQALKMAEAQAALAAETGDQIGAVNALNAMAGVYWDLGNLPAAERAARQAFPLAERIGNKPGMAAAANMVGIVLEDDVEAVQWFLRSALLAGEMGERSQLGGPLINISFLLRERGEYARSLALVGRAVREALADGDVPDACRCFMQVARMLWTLNRLPEAEALLRALIGAYRRTHSPHFLVGMQRTLAEVLLDQGRPGEAAAVLEDAYATVGRGADVVYGGNDYGRMLALASIRTRLALDRIDVPSALAEVDALGPGANPHIRAEIVYRRWQISGTEADRCAAAAVLRDTHALSPYVRYRARYYELTGERLPAPPPLPDVSALIPSVPDLDTLIMGITALLPQLAVAEQPASPA